MEIERFLEIMSSDGIVTKLSEEGCNAMKGLTIIQKYIHDSGIAGAGHDVIWSVNVEELITAGITEEDTIELRAQNWMTEGDEYMACFV